MTEKHRQALEWLENPEKNPLPPRIPEIDGERECMPIEIYKTIREALDKPVEEPYQLADAGKCYGCGGNGSRWNKSGYLCCFTCNPTIKGSNAEPVDEGMPEREYSEEEVRKIEMDYIEKNLPEEVYIQFFIESDGEATNVIAKKTFTSIYAEIPEDIFVFVRADLKPPSIEPVAWIHECDAGSEVCESKEHAEQKLEMWGGTVSPLYKYLALQMKET